MIEKSFRCHAFLCHAIKGLISENVLGDSELESRMEIKNKLLTEFLILRLLDDGVKRRVMLFLWPLYIALFLYPKSTAVLLHVVIIIRIFCCTGPVGRIQLGYRFYLSTKDSRNFRYPIQLEREVEPNS